MFFTLLFKEGWGGLKIMKEEIKKILNAEIFNGRLTGKKEKIFLGVFVFVGVICAVVLVYWSYATNLYIAAAQASGDFSSESILNHIKTKTRHKAEPIKVKGLYITAYSASSAKKVQEIIDLIKATELNAVVIDVKDYSGNVLYDSNLPLVNELDNEMVLIKNLSGLVEKFKKEKIYTIARVSSFQDPKLAESKPEWALKSKNGGLWRDRKGLAWVDANKKEVWDYIIDIAKEAGRAGFDEINFDYIRFPTDGNLENIAYTNGDRKKYEVIGEFYKYLSEKMAREPVYTSADLFGLTTERKGEDDMNIGQRIIDAAKYFDYVCPMVYPSHYPPDYMGFSNPADHPYEVVKNAMGKGIERTKGERAKLRTWIQYFNMGAIYDGEKVRAQIKASDEVGADGWILWNARNVYDGRGILKE